MSLAFLGDFVDVSFLKLGGSCDFKMVYRVLSFLTKVGLVLPIVGPPGLTNQPPQVRSRITVALHYEALGFAGRESVWRNLLKIPGGISACFVAIVL